MALRVQISWSSAHCRVVVHYYAWLGPHWQAWSLGAQPALLIALERHEVCGLSARMKSEVGETECAHSASWFSGEILASSQRSGGEDESGLHGVADGRLLML